MSSEAVTVTLEHDGADTGSLEGVGSTLADACVSIPSTSTMCNGTETVATTAQERLALSSSSNQSALSSGDWSVVKQCFSVFVIEVYQCKLCGSFNSTQRATVARHLKEVHPTEWLILKEADSVASLPGARGLSSITKGDLEQMVEKELTDGNNQKQSDAKDGTFGNLGLLNTGLPFRLENVRQALPLEPVISSGLPEEQEPVSTTVALQTALVSPLASTEQEGAPACVEISTPAGNGNVRARRGRPKSVRSAVSGRLGAQTAQDCPGDSSSTSLPVSLRKSSPGGLSPLRPVLSRTAKCRPREFKDFVVSVPGWRASPSADSSDMDVKEESTNSDGKETQVTLDEGVMVIHREEQGTAEAEGVPSKGELRPNPGAIRLARHQCLTCLTTFGTADALSRHQKLNRCVGIPITSREFPCDKCPFKGHSVASLKIHRHIHVRRKEKTYGCTFCKRGFTSLKSVHRHRATRCPVLKTKPPRAPKLFPCEQCDKVFKVKKALEEHTATHSEVRRHKCDVCPKAFKTYGALRRHRKKHRDAFVYCDQCSFKTRWSSSLKTHFRAHHAQDSREYFQCPKCPYQTPNKYYLRRHLDSHLDVRSFMCEICGKNFKTQVILNTHLETHRNGQYPCGKCPYVGKTKMAIYSHQLVHMPRELMSYKCEQCDWVGKRKSELRIHYRKHSSLKLYHCSVCGKSYKHRHALSRHLSEKHLEKAAELPPLPGEEEVGGMAAEQTAVLETVQEMLDSGQIGLRVQAQEEVHDGLPTLLRGAQLKAELNVQQYQVIQMPGVGGEVPADHVEALTVQHPHEVLQHPHEVLQHPHEVLQNPHVVMTAAPVPVAQFFEITTTDGAGDGPLPVHTAQ